nr:PREDICTED: uncharacterized protein LOC103313876 isoform X2 [Tribolium castaneum]|eukprot:XP_008196524.2 PREDICTED: uncharacterized protein LOC103313876 isoform X2 [Tribolium castaneum]
MKHRKRRLKPQGHTCYHSFIKKLVIEIARRVHSVSKSFDNHQTVKVVVLGYKPGLPINMGEDEINIDILRLHGYTSEGDSDDDDGGKTELDDFYYYHKPQPIDIDPSRDKIIKVGVTKISKNQLRRLRKKFANDGVTNQSEVGTTETVNSTEGGTTDSQLLTKSQKKRLRKKKRKLTTQNAEKVQKNPDDGATKRDVPKDMAQFQKKGRSSVELPLLWLQNCCDLRSVTVILIVIVLQKVPYLCYFLFFFIPLFSLW